MKFLQKIPVPLLGILFIIFSVQFFVMIATHAAMPPMDGMAAQFMGVFFASGMVWFVKLVELTAGILLVVPRTRKIGLLLIAPIVVGILLVEWLIVMPPTAQMIPAFLVFVLTVIGFYQYRADFIKVIK